MSNIDDANLPTAATSPRRRTAIKARHIFMFLIAGAIVYWSGQMRANRSAETPSYKATATVLLETAVRPDGTPSLARPDLQDVRTTILAEPNLRGVLDNTTSSAERTVTPIALSTDDLQRSVQLAIEDEAVGGQYRVAISYTCNDRPTAAAIVNALGRSYVREVADRWRAPVLLEYADAQDATKRAEEESAAAAAAMSTFLESQPQEPSSLRQPPLPSEEGSPFSRNTTQAPSGYDSIDPSDPTDPISEDEAAKASDLARTEETPTDNSDWAALNGRLRELLTRRADLLDVRTDEHPEVKFINVQIAEVERRLVGVPRTVPPDTEDGWNPLRPYDDNREVIPSPSDPTPEAITPADPSGSPSDRTYADVLEAQRLQAESMRGYQTLQVNLAHAATRLEEARRRERAALEGTQRKPPVELIAGRAEEIHAQSATPRGLMLAALSAGLAVVAGVGLVSAGTGISPPLRTLDQAEAALPVPVTGVIPESDAAVEPRPQRTGQAAKRWILIAGGCVLLAGCLGLLAQVSGLWTI